MFNAVFSSSAPQRPLRLALGGNALFSAFSGLLLLLLPDTLAQLLGISAPFLLPALGLGLLLFAADLLHQIHRPRLATWRALYASLSDFAWVLGSLLLLVFWPTAFAPEGLWLIAAVALLVGLFGALQLQGIRWAHRAPQGPLYRHCLSVAVPVGAEAMWEMIGDMGNIQRYMPSLTHSELRNGSQPGVGVVRHCINHKQQAWSEACTVFEPGRSFSLRFLSDEPDFPFPASEMYGGWEVLPDGLHHSTVTVWWELQPRPRWLAPVLMPLLAFQADRDFTHIIANMAQRAPVSAAGIRPDVQGRLLSRFC